jgi:hypothetical protein
MFKARPVYNVFVVDRFEVIAANAVDDESREKRSRIPVAVARLARNSPARWSRPIPSDKRTS